MAVHCLGKKGWMGFGWGAQRAHGNRFEKGDVKRRVDIRQSEQLKLNSGVDNVLHFKWAYIRRYQFPRFSLQR